MIVKTYQTSAVNEETFRDILRGINSKVPVVDRETIQILAMKKETELRQVGTLATLPRPRQTM